MAINQDKLHEFLGKAIVDFGAVFSAALIRIGDKLGLTKPLLPAGRRPPRNSPAKRIPPSATSGNGSRIRPLAAT